MRLLLLEIHHFHSDPLWDSHRQLSNEENLDSLLVLLQQAIQVLVIILQPFLRINQDGATMHRVKHILPTQILVEADGLIKNIEPVFEIHDNLFNASTLLQEYKL